MREQIITPRANGRAVLTSARGRSGSVIQKPAKRGGNAQGSGGVVRKVLSYLPFVGKLLLAVIAGVLIFAGYRAAAAASFFEARRVDVTGAQRTSSDEIKNIVRHAVSATGVWRADLLGISKEVEALPWVRKAIVSRVLPDGLRVRVIERVPRAVVRLSSGKFVWVDEDAVSLSQMAPTDQIPAFFIRGWDEAGTNDAKAENRERIQKYLEMSRELETLGLSERVSEVNLGDPHDIRALLAGDDAQIEVRLGERNLGPRLQRALKVLDDQRSTSMGPFITYLVASQDGKITVGHRADAPAANVENGTTESGQTASVSAEIGARTPTTVNSRNKAEAPSKKETRSVVRDEHAVKQKAKQPGPQKSETRPRRVV